MSLPSLDLNLPVGEAPPRRSKKISWNAYLDWLEENRREWVRTGQLKKRLADPFRRPVPVPFRLP